MIFAELEYEPHYSELHAELVELLEANFTESQHGPQGDSWIWIFDGDEKVAIDTFSSMEHQVKSDSKEGRLARQVLAVLGEHYQVNEYAEPELEPHED